MTKGPSKNSVSAAQLQSLEARSGVLSDLHKLSWDTAQAELLQFQLGTGSDDPVIEEHLDQVRNADFMTRLLFGAGLELGSQQDLEFWQNFRKDLKAFQTRIDTAVALIKKSKQLFHRN